MAVNVAAAGVSIALTIFLLAISAFLYLFPFLMDYLKQSFSEGILMNLVIRRGFFIIATYLMVLNSSIMNIMIQQAGFTLGGPMVMYIFLFGYLGYLMLFYLAIKTIFDLMKVWSESQKEKRGFV